MTALLVPVKRLSSAKTRLDSLLPPSDREALATLLLRHVLDCARAVPGIHSLNVTTRDRIVVELAERLGVRVIPEPPASSGLNQTLQVTTDALVAGGEPRVLIVFADLPLLEPDDLAAADGALKARPHSVVVAPSVRGGTALLGLWQDRPPWFVFGADSYASFLRLCEKSHIPVQPLPRPGFTQDLDEPADIEPVLASPACPAEVRRILEPYAAAAQRKPEA